MWRFFLRLARRFKLFKRHKKPAWKPAKVDAKERTIFL